MRILSTICLGCLYMVSGSAQEMNLNVRLVFEHAIAQEQVVSAKTLSDINPGYPASWIQDYVSVELATDSDGEIHNSMSKNDMLSKEQTDLLRKADIGTDVTVKVMYIQKNSAGSETKEMNFSYRIAPDVEAEFPGGYEALESYVKESVTSKIPLQIIKENQFATIQFTISEEGELMNVDISSSSEDEDLDNLLLTIISGMPTWSPAQRADGIRVEQQFEISIGNGVGC